METILLIPKVEDSQSASYPSPRSRIAQRVVPLQLPPSISVETGAACRRRRPCSGQQSPAYHDIRTSKPQQRSRKQSLEQTSRERGSATFPAISDGFNNNFHPPENRVVVEGNSQILSHSIVFVFWIVPHRQVAEPSA